MKSLIFIVLSLFLSLFLFPENSPDNENIFEKWKEWDYMTGSWGGKRSIIEEHGFIPSVDFTTVFGKVFAGGHEKGWSAPFMLRFSILLNSEKAGLWKGSSLFFGGEWCHSFSKTKNLTANYAGGFQTLHRLDDTPHYIQLGEYWFEQKFFNGLTGFRIGKQYPSDLFLNHMTAREFSNTSFYVIPTVPMSRYRTSDKHFSAYVNSPVRKQIAPSLGISAFWQISEHLKLSAGIFDQRPEPKQMWFSEEAKKYKNISVLSELLFLPEFNLNHPLPGEYRLGIWYVNKTDYSDTPQEDIHPHAKKFRGTGGPFIAFDQTIFKEKSLKDDKQGLYLFGQFGFAPGKWEIMFYYGGGILYRGLLPHRNMDTSGIAFAIADFSEKMEGIQDTETGEYKTSYAMHNMETVIEYFYKIHAGKWFSLHHSIQWIRIPKGITDPFNRYYSKNAFVFNLSCKIQL